MIAAGAVTIEPVTQHGQAPELRCRCPEFLEQNCPMRLASPVCPLAERRPGRVRSTGPPPDRFGLLLRLLDRCQQRSGQSLEGEGIGTCDLDQLAELGSLLSLDLPSPFHEGLEFGVVIARLAGHDAGPRFGDRLTPGTTSASTLAVFATRAAEARRAQLQAEVAEMQANHDDWVKAGMLAKLERCGPRARPCVSASMRGQGRSAIKAITG